MGEKSAVFNSFAFSLDSLVNFPSDQKEAISWCSTSNHV